MLRSPTGWRLCNNAKHRIFESARSERKILIGGAQVRLKQRLRALAPGLTPRSVLEKMAAIQMVDMHLPTTDGRTVLLSRYTEPELDQLTPPCVVPTFRPYAAENLEFGGFYASSCESRVNHGHYVTFQRPKSQSRGRRSSTSFL
jgi:hypothetical protein